MSEHHWSGPWFEVERWTRGLIPRDLPPAPRPNPFLEEEEEEDEDGEDQEADESEEEEEEGEDEDEEAQDDGDGGEDEESEDEDDGSPFDLTGDDDWPGDEAPQDPRVPSTILFRAGSRQYLRPLPDETAINVLDYEPDDLVVQVRTRLGKILDEHSAGRRQLAIQMVATVLDHDANPVPSSTIEPFSGTFTDTRPAFTPIVPPPAPLAAQNPAPPPPPVAPPPLIPTGVPLSHQERMAQQQGQVHEVATIANLTNSFMGHIGALVSSIMEMSRMTLEQQERLRREAQEEARASRTENSEIMKRVMDAQLEKERIRADSRVTLAQHERNVEAHERERLAKEAEEARLRLRTLQEQQRALAETNAQLEEKMRLENTAATEEEMKAQMAQMALGMLQQAGEYMFSKGGKSETKPDASPPPVAAPAPVAETPKRSAPPGAPRATGKRVSGGGDPLPVDAKQVGDLLQKLTAEQRRAFMASLAAEMTPQEVGQLAEALVDTKDPQEGGA